MTSQTRLPRPARATLVTVGVALCTLGGVGAVASIAADAGSSTPAAQRLPVTSGRLATAAPAAVFASAPAAAAPAVRRPKPARRPSQRSAQASRSAHRHVVRPRPPHRALRFGSRGPAVRWLQRRLGVRRTGRFASHTRAAVRHFQRRHHVRANGVVGRRTWVLLASTAHGHVVHHRHVAHHKRAHHTSVHRHQRHQSARHHARRRHHARHRRHHAPLTTRQRIHAVLRLARAQRGKPYVWGAAGPHAFDCSGYVQWVYRHALGIHLPKYTDTQYRALPHIRAREVHVGDLVFVRHGRHESHVGIYAGHHRWWVAPHTGSHVKLQRIWPAHHVYARVLH